MTRRSQLAVTVFFLVAFGIPWAGWSYVQDEQLSLWVFPLFASIAGFAATVVEGGKTGLVAFCRRVFSAGGALRYVCMALCIPLLLGLSYLLVTGVPVAAIAMSPAAVLGLSWGAALITGPMAEEFGWRGYLQHAFLKRMAPFWTAMAVGAIWWVWHFALYRTSVFASTASAMKFLAYLETWSIFMVFLVERAGGSVWPAVAFHWAANMHASVLQALFPTLDGGLLPGGSKGSLFYVGVAGVFVLVNHKFFFRMRSIASMSAGSGMTRPA